MKHKAIELAEPVADAIIEHFEDVHGLNVGAYIRGDGHTFSLIEIDDEDTLISRSELRERIIELVKPILEKHNQVAVYTCRDNAEIDIDEVYLEEPEYNDPEELSFEGHVYSNVISFAYD